MNLIIVDVVLSIVMVSSDGVPTWLVSHSLTSALISSPLHLQAPATSMALHSGHLLATLCSYTFYNIYSKDTGDNIYY